MPTSTDKQFRFSVCHNRLDVLTTHTETETSSVNASAVCYGEIRAKQFSVVDFE